MDNIYHPSDNWDLLNNLMLLNVLLIPVTGHKNVYWEQIICYTSDTLSVSERYLHCTPNRYILSR